MVTVTLHTRISSSRIRACSSQIAFEYVNMVDGGKTLIFGGGRIVPEEAGRGYHDALVRFAESEMCRLFPNPSPKRSVASGFWNKVQQNHLEKKSDQYRLLVKRVCVWSRNKRCNSRALKY